MAVRLPIRRSNGAIRGLRPGAKSSSLAGRGSASNAGGGGGSADARAPQTQSSTKAPSTSLQLVTVPGTGKDMSELCYETSLVSDSRFHATKLTDFIHPPLICAALFIVCGVGNETGIPPLLPGSSYAICAILSAFRDPRSTPPGAGVFYVRRASPDRPASARKISPSALGEMRKGG